MMLGPRRGRISVASVLSFDALRSVVPSFGSCTNCIRMLASPADREQKMTLASTGLAG